MIIYNYTQTIITEVVYKWLQTLEFPFEQCTDENLKLPTYFDVNNWLYLNKHILITPHLYAKSWSVKIEDYGKAYDTFVEERQNPGSSYKSAKYKLVKQTEIPQYGNCWELGADCNNFEDCIISAINYLMNNNLVK